MPSSIIRHPVTPDDDAQSPQERDFGRWRTAIHIIQRLREAGIKCELNNGDQNAQLTYYTHDAGASLHRMEPLRYTIVQLKKSDMAC